MLAKTPARNVANFLLCALAADAVLSPLLATAQPQPQLLPAIALAFYLLLLLVLPLWILALPVLLTTDAAHPRALLRYAVSAAIPPLLLLAFNTWLQARSGAILYRRPTLTGPGFPLSFLELVTTLSLLSTALYLFFSRRNKHLPS